MKNSKSFLNTILKKAYVKHSAKRFVQNHRLEHDTEIAVDRFVHIPTEIHKMYDKKISEARRRIYEKKNQIDYWR